MSALLSGQAYAQISVHSDAASFNAAVGSSTEIDFEALPTSGTSCPFAPFDTPIQNPLVLAGVVFTDPHCLGTGFCSSPSCTADPDNALGGNIVLFLNPGGTIDFPAGTIGALVEGVGTATFTLRATDGAGNTVTTTGQGVPFGTVVRGFTAASGISQIELVSTSGGPIAIATLHEVRAAGVPALIDALDAQVTTLVASGALTQGQGNALHVKLAAALQSANQGNMRAADNQLRSLLNQIEGLVGAGVLTADQGQALSAAIAEIRSRLIG